MKKVIITDLSLNIEKITDLQDVNTKGGATNPKSCLVLGCTGSMVSPWCPGETVPKNTAKICC